MKFVLEIDGNARLNDKAPGHGDSLAELVASIALSIHQNYPEDILPDRDENGDRFAAEVIDPETDRVIARAHYVHEEFDPNEMYHNPSFEATVAEIRARHMEEEHEGKPS